MMTLKIGDKDYKVKFGYNNFCDSDLLENVEEMIQLLNGAKSDADVTAMGKMKDLFLVVRDCLFEGFKKENPVGSLQEVGDLLDNYREETPKDENGEITESRGVLDLFLMLCNELMNEGFLGDLMAKMIQTMQEMNSNAIESIPQDHKKPQKKVAKK